MNFFEDYLQFTTKNNNVVLSELSEYLSFLYSFYDFAYLEFNNEKKVYEANGKDYFSKIFIEFIQENKESNLKNNN